jgi:hypothetical protein
LGTGGDISPAEIAEMAEIKTRVNNGLKQE